MLAASQSCSQPLGTAGGEAEAELVTSPVSLGWCHTWVGCRAGVLKATGTG